MPVSTGRSSSDLGVGGRDELARPLSNTLLGDVEGDLVVPMEGMPPALKKSMSDRWSQKVRNQKILEEQAK